MLPYKIGTDIIKKHKIIQESESVQRFYGGPCFSIIIENEDYLDEVIKVIEEA